MLHVIMKPMLAIISVFHICVPVFSYSSDVSFLMQRNPDNYFCAHLQCVADVTHSDHDVSSLVEMTIYDITRVNSDLKLASVSRFHPDLYVDTTKSSSMSCTGIISRHQANLTVQLRHDIDCLYGVYKCQLDLVTVSGHSEMLTEILTPELNQNYSRMEEIISHFSRLTELINSHTVEVNNQIAQINRRVNKLDDQTVQINRLASQSDNQTILINILAGQSGNQTVQINRLANQLVNQTVQINRLASQSDNQTVQRNRLANQLVNQTVQINRLASQSDNQTVQINRLVNQLDNQKAQLTDQKAKLNTISSRLHMEQAEQKQLQEITQERLKTLEAECITGQPGISGPTKVIWLGDIFVLCDTSTDGGGWILIQRRTRGDVDFYRNWTDYKNGFGTPYTDFWIGNDAIHNLTTQGFNELRFDLKYKGKEYFAHYSNFSIGSESVNYRLSVSGYSGTAGDILSYHNNMYFSTNDRDNDKFEDYNCAFQNKGGWWYSSCFKSNLNGQWRNLIVSTLGVSVAFTEIKIRRR